MSEYRQCHEEVIRGGELEPCDKLAVALRYDEEGQQYPVCSRHSRGPMVPLAAHDAEVAAAAWDEGNRAGRKGDIRLLAQAGLTAAVIKGERE